MIYELKPQTTGINVTNHLSNLQYIGLLIIAQFPTGLKIIISRKLILTSFLLFQLPKYIAKKCAAKFEVATHQKV